MSFTRLEPTGVNTTASFTFANVNVAHTIRANNFFYSNGAPIGSGSGGSGGVAITVSANEQPNITSVGTLTSLTVEGPVDLGSIGNITIPGGAQDYVLSTDGSGHLNWLQISTGNPAGQVGALQFNDNGVFNGSGNLTFDKTTNTLNITNISTDGIKLNTLGNGQIAISLNNDIVGGPDLIWEFDNAALFTTALKSNGYITIDGNITSGNANLGNTVTANYFKGSGNNLSNIQGSNVTGAVSYATTANSVAGANVSGAVSYATTANSVAGANVTGTVASATVAASANSVAGANVSGAVTFASTANSVAGANVSGTVASATVAASANSVAGANVTGTVASATVAASANSVAAANVSGLGNLALVNKDGNASNILYGNGVFASAPVTYGNSNVATYLASYGSNTITTTGNVSVGNIIGNGQSLTGLNAANLTGTISSTVLGNSPHYIGTTSISLTRPSGSQTLTGVSIDGSAASATTAGTVTTNAQPNITSVGTLTSLSVSGDATVSGNLTVNGSTVYTNITNMTVKDPLIELGGGANGAALASNDGKDRGELLHYYTTAPVDAFMGWDNSNAEFAFGSNVSVTNEVITFNTLGNVRAGYFIGNGSQITGVAAANVTGLGNIATINKDGNASNILYGNGVFASAPVTYGNSNVATYLASYGSNTITTTGNVTVGNIIGNGQSLSGLAGANVTGQVSNSLIAGTVYTSAQPNITSVGTLTGVTSTGTVNLTGASNVSLGPVANVHISGGSAGYVLTTDGSGALSWAAQSGGSGGNVTASQYISKFTLSSALSLTTNADTTITFNNQVYDPQSWFNTGNSQFKPTIAGYYKVTFVVFFTSGSSNTSQYNIQIRKNGTTILLTQQPQIGGQGQSLIATDSVYMNGTTDYLTFTAYTNTTASAQNSSNGTYFEAFLVGSAATTSYIGNAQSNVNIASANANITMAVNGTSNVIVVANTGVTVTGNITSTGYGVFNGAYTESTTNPGVFIGNTGSGTPSPRIGFYNGNTTQNWQIDNFGGNFRWFTPGVTRMQLDSNGNLSLPNGNMSVPNGNVSANYFIGNGSQLTGITVASTGTVTTNAQPNITSVGTLTSLTVTGTVTSSNNLIGSDQLVLNSKAGATEGAQLVLGWKTITGLTGQGNSTWNMDIDGSNNLRIFSQDASGTSRVSLTASPTNTDITVGGNILASNGNLGNLVTANYHSGSGNMLSNIQGANVTGAVAYATTANSVAVANVSGIGNIATINKDGNASNILYGNGVFASAPVTYGNSNVATFLASFGSNTITTSGNVSVGNIIGNGQALTGINGSNVTGAVSYATTANAVAGANVSGAVSYATTANSVAGANVSGAVAYATTANAVAGANVTGQVSNSLIAGTVYTAAQPNITSVGTLTSLSVTGNTTSGNIISNGSVSGVDLSISGNATISGNLIVSGTTAYTNVTTLAIKDPLIEIGGGANGATLASNDSKDRGSLLHYYTTAPVDAFMGWDNSNAEFAFGSNVSVTNEVVTFNSLGNVRAGYFIGNGSQLTGLVATVASTVTSNAQPNITSVGTLTSLAVTSNITSGNANLGNLVTANFFSGAGNNLSNIQGSNVSGQVSNSLVAGTVYTAAQPNITSVGTLTSLAVTGNITSGNANLGNLITANFFSGAGNLLSNIQGANVTGAVSYATTANSVAAANVSGLGNLALLNKDGNASNILYGNGVFASAPVTYGNSNVATYLASYGSNTITTTGNVSVGNIIGNGQALTGINGSNVTGQVANSLVAGTVYTNAQPNITSVGTLTSLTVTGNVTAGNISYSGSMSMGTGNGGTLSGANLISANYFSGSGNLLSNIQVGNITGLGNVALLNKDGNASNILYGNGVFAAPSGSTYGNSNVATFLANLGSNIISSTANIVTTGKILGGITTTSLTNPVAVFSGGGATYSQLAVINPTGTGSADITTYGNNGDDTQSWADIGFTGNAFNDANYTVTGPGDGYFFTQGNASFGGNMVIATGATGTTKDIVFATGGFLTANIKARLYNANGVFSVTNGISTGNLTANVVTLKKFNETVLASANTAASISPDVSTGTIFKYTANAAFTFNGLTNAVAGTSATVVITQDATGGRVMTSTMKFAGGLKTLSTVANAIDIISVFYDGTTYYASLAKGFA